ncbi:MAG: hypothetical protein Q9160_002355 [Pyrenula sp. 1 TL-2023]
MSQSESSTSGRVPSLAIYLDHGEGYLLSQHIGSGGDGSVFQFQSVSQSRERPSIACKILPAPVIEEYPWDSFEVPGDVRYPAKQHSTLIDVEKTERFPNKMYMVISRYCNGGNLRSFMDEWGRLFYASPDKFDLFVPEVFFWALMVDLLQALTTLHCDSDPQTAHGDLCAVNVFLHYDQAMGTEGENVMPRFVLGDFGAAQHRGYVNATGDKVNNEEFRAQIRTDVSYSSMLLRELAYPRHDYGPDGFCGISDEDWNCETIYSMESLKALQMLEQQGHNGSWGYDADAEGDLIDQPLSDSDLTERINDLRALYDELIETARERKHELMSSNHIRKDLFCISSTRPNVPSSVKSIPIPDLQTLFSIIAEFVKYPWAEEREFQDSDLWFLLDKLILIGAPIRLVYIDPQTSHITGEVDFAELAKSYGVDSLPPGLASGDETFAEWVDSIRDVIDTGGGSVNQEANTARDSSVNF